MISLKLILIGILGLSLLIPALMVRGLIEERRARRGEVVREISDKWGGDQIILGPMLRVVCTLSRVDDENKPYTVTRTLTTLPDTYSVDGQLQTEVRKRGIFEAVLYSSEVNVNGTLRIPAIPFGNEPMETIVRVEAYLLMGIQDLKGIRSSVTGEFADQKIELQAGPGTIQEARRLQAPVELPDTGELLSFSIRLELNGSGGLYFSPVGKTTEIHLHSDWNAPSFDGAFLPQSSEVDGEGFQAHWKVLSYNRSFPQTWINQEANLDDSRFGVRLVIPADIYQQTHRTAKYAIIFILFTFSGFFLAEVISCSRVHPMQYLMIGSGLVVFYLLLLSLAEHLGFGLSFLLASGATILLLGWYAGQIMQLARFGLGVSLILSLMYAYLYILLQSSDHALLLGSLAVFAVLGITMFVTRKIDWYQIQYRTP